MRIDEDRWVTTSYRWLVVEVDLRRFFCKQSVGLSCGPVMKGEAVIASSSWVPGAELVLFHQV